MNRRSLFLSVIAALLPLPALAAPRTLASKLGLSSEWRVIEAPAGKYFEPASFVIAVDKEPGRIFVMFGGGFGPLHNVKYAAYVPGSKFVFAGEEAGNWKMVGKFI